MVVRPRTKRQSRENLVLEEAATESELISFVAPASCRLSRGHLALAGEGGTPSRQPPRRRRYKEDWVAGSSASKRCSQCPRALTRADLISEQAGRTPSAGLRPHQKNTVPSA